MSDQNEAPARAGAVQELARDDVSRKRFLAMAGAGGAAAFSLFLAACGDDDESASNTMTGAAAQEERKPPGGGDLKIVNYALTLEYLEADFYDKVAASGLFKGAQLDLVKRIGDAEQEHVEALTAAAKQLGGTPAAKPKTQFPIENAKEVVQLAATVENLGAAAYLGQAGNISSKEILAAALAIHSVEGRHAAALNTLAGKPITPDGAFAKPASMQQVLADVKPFIVA